MSQSVRILIFAKLPRAGSVKTRLIPALGADGAARLAQRMLRHTATEALAAALGPVELCVSPSPGDPGWSEQGLPEGLEWSDQGDGDLGERLARAAERSLGRGAPVLLIGTDCPEMDAIHLRAASQTLTLADAVMAPAADGGYVLLGLNRFDASLFRNIAWSTASVAGATLARLRALAWRVELLPVRHDIDEPEDLPRLPPGWLDTGHESPQKDITGRAL